MNDFQFIQSKANIINHYSKSKSSKISNNQINLYLTYQSFNTLPLVIHLRDYLFLSNGDASPQTTPRLIDQRNEVGQRKTCACTQLLWDRSLMFVLLR